MESKFETWAIVEIMGHQRLAGYVTEQEIAGRAFIRVDVPEPNRLTKLIGPQSVHSLTPVTEEVARLAAANISSTPVTKWGIPDEWFAAHASAQLTGPTNDDDDEDIPV